MNHIAQTLRAGLGRKSESRFSDPADFFQDMGGEGVYPRRGQRDGDLEVRKTVHDRPQERVHAAIVAGTQTEQRDLFIAALFDQLVYLFLEGARVALPQGAINIAGLAKATAAHAAAHDFRGHAIVYDVHIRHDLGGKLGDGIEVFNNAFFDNRAVGIAGADVAQRTARGICRFKKGRDVDTGDVA